MSMETISLADCDLLTNNGVYKLSDQESFMTRLVRVDLPKNISRDPLRYRLHLFLRHIWFRRRDTRGPDENLSDISTTRRKFSQNTTMMADWIARFLIALITGLFLILPLVILNYQTSSKAHLMTVSLCIFVFSGIISLGSKASNQEIVVASAGYAAVLVVFVSSSSCPNKV